MSLKPLIAANWKMHGDMSWSEKPSEFSELYPPQDREHIDILICPPAMLIAPMVQASASAAVLIGGQTCYSENSGAHTGEISAPMLRSAGAEYVILGHSERRASGETDEDVCARVKRAAEAGLSAIICVGESLEERKAGDAEVVVADQLKGSLPEGLTDFIIAYEPVWAIGTGMTATPDDIFSMHSFIRGLVGDTVKILYGGSVKPGNAEDILSTDNVNGALIGGAGLEMESLAQIARLAPR